MKLTYAALATVAALVVGVGGGVAATQLGGDDSSTADAPSTPSPSVVPGSPHGLGDGNLIDRALYRELSGHAFTPAAFPSRQPLALCNDVTFSEVLPDGSASGVETKFVGAEEGLEVVEQIAQLESGQSAVAAAEEIVTKVAACNAAIQGGDFGYAGPEAMVSEANRKVVYFRAFDSDRAFGGFVVFAVGTRVGVLEVADLVAEGLLIRLAEKAATLAAA